MTDHDYKKINVILIVVILVGVLSCFRILVQINKDKSSTILANQADIKTTIQNLQNITDSIEAELTTIKNSVETNLKQIKSRNQSISIDFQALDSVVDGMNASVKTLEQDVSFFKEYFEELDNSESPEAIAEESYKLATSSLTDASKKKYYYLNSIYHDPTNIVYYEEYINFLDSVGASYEEYWNLSNITESAMLQMATDAIERLFPIYELINGNSLLQPEDSEIENQTDESFAKWEDTKDAFFSYWSSKTFNKEEFEQRYVLLMESYSALNNPSKEIQFDIASAENIYSLFNLYRIAVDNKKLLDQLSNQDFEILYKASEVARNEAILGFLVRDLSLDRTYNYTITGWQQEISRMEQSLAGRFDKILIDKILSKCRILYGLAQKITSETLSQLESEFMNLQIQYSQAMASLKSEASTEERSTIENLMREISEAIYNQQFINYQIWASDRIVILKKEVDAARTPQKLEKLYENGFSEINPSLLIPHIKTAYDALSQDAARDKSAIKESELIKKYIKAYKALGEV